MRFIIALLFVLIMVHGLIVSANAFLKDNGNGTITQIRSDGSKLMWLKDANTAFTSGYCLILGNCSEHWGYGSEMTWDQANKWIKYLNSTNYLGYNDWRLPDVLPVNGISYSYNWLHDGSSDRGYNVSAPGSAYPGSTAGELAYLYYVELGNLGNFDILGNSDQPGWGFYNSGPFINVTPDGYWLGREYAPNPDEEAWDFNFHHGFQSNCNKNCIGVSVWAVRSVMP